MPRKFVLISHNKLSEKIEEAQGPRFNRYNWPKLTPQIEKDLKKCHFDCENVEIGPGSIGPKGLMGYTTLDNGLSFLGICAGGDWEVPVFFIIYWDGEKLRGYIPIEGNPWNTTTRQAYGNYTDEIWEDGKNLKQRDPKQFGALSDAYANEKCSWLRHNAFEIKRDLALRFEEKE